MNLFVFACGVAESEWKKKVIVQVLSAAADVLDRRNQINLTEDRFDW